MEKGINVGASLKRKSLAPCSPKAFKLTAGHIEKSIFHYLNYINLLSI